MKNLKLGFKLGIGFGIVLLIMCVLGVTAIRELTKQQEGAASISEAFMPELILAVRFERATQLTVQHMLQFISSGNDSSYRDATNQMSAMGEVAKEANALVTAYPYLKRLEQNLKEANQLFTSYQDYADKTHTMVMGLNDSREHLQQTADSFFSTLDNLLAVGFTQLNQEIRNGVTDDELLSRVRNIELINRVVELGNKLQAANSRAQILGDPDIGEKALVLFDPMLVALADLKQAARPQNLGKVQEVETLTSSYRDEFQKMMADWKSLKKLSAERTEVVGNLLANAQRTSTAGISQVQRVCEEAKNVAAESNALITGGLIGGVLLGLLLSLFLTRLTTIPLRKSVNFAVSVADGHLDDKLDIRQNDEVGQLAVALNTMVTTLSRRIRDAQEAMARAESKEKEATVAMRDAEQARAQAENAKRQGMLDAAGQLESIVSSVSAASQQLAAQVEQASRGAQEQASRAGETAASMDEMNSTVIEVARNAGTTAEASNQARQKATAGAEVVLQVVSGMDHINKGALDLKKDMEELSRKAESIGSILNVISDIADQTNLLALNAAIEAARAGEAGRGFAVVADEVRKLAEKTMQATSEVGQAIKGIQQGTSQNMAKVEDTVEVVNGVTEMATRSGQALTEIVKLVDHASDQIRTIASASEQQSVTTEKISRSVDEVSRIAAETATAMEESGRAVTDLSSQAQILYRLINDMKKG